MGISLVSLIAGFLIARLGRAAKWWFKAHRVLGIGGGTGALTALAAAVIMISLTHGFHFSNLHTVLGLVTMVFISLSFVLPAFFRRVRKSAKLPLRKVHMVSGIFSIVLMIASVVFGLSFRGII
jgi:hypothetical protein